MLVTFEKNNVWTIPFRGAKIPCVFHSTELLNFIELLNFNFLFMILI